MNEAIRNRITGLYCLLFYLLMFYKIMNGMLLYQLQPFMFFTKLDFTTWLVMLTNLHQWLLQDTWRLLLADILFYSMPALYYGVYLKAPRLLIPVGITMLVINYLYVTIYCSYPTISPEGQVAWLLFPFLFLCRSIKSFWFIMQGLRYYFLYFFLSAGIWKLVQQGFFDTDTMSAVLQSQHSSLLTTNSYSLRSNIYNWLIINAVVSSLIYKVATIAELSFGIGFFTRRFDRYLVWLFLLFLFFNMLLMRIDYWETAPFLLTLFFSGYRLPENEITKHTKI